ncbi:ISL3 family transposase, partial [Enterococcus faecium]
LVQLIVYTFGMNRIKETDPLLKSKAQQHYQLGKQLKGYCKLLQKDERQLGYVRRFWRPGFKAHFTESDIVDLLLNGSAVLRVGYQLYQDFLYAVKERVYVSFE